MSVPFHSVHHRQAQDGAVPDLVPAHLSGYNFEPECKPEALANLTEFQLASTLYVGSVDGTAAEQTSRRAAMDNASSNAADMIEKFTMQYKGCWLLEPLFSLDPYWFTRSLLPTCSPGMFIHFSICRDELTLGRMQLFNVKQMM